MLPRLALCVTWTKQARDKSPLRLQGVVIQRTKRIFLREQPLAKIRRGNGIAARHTASVAYSLRFGTGRKKGAALLQTPGQSTSGFAIAILPFSLRPQFFLTKPNLRSSLHDAPLIDSISFFLTSQFVSDKLQEYLSCFPLTLTSKIAS